MVPGEVLNAARWDFGCFTLEQFLGFWPLLSASGAGGEKYVGKTWENHWEKRGNSYEGPWLVEVCLFSVVMS